MVLKSIGFFERAFHYKKMNDGTFERRRNGGFGLMAFEKKPKNSFHGKVYVIIGAETYSGGSEFVNMMHTNELATFVGQETGGGYYGNTSGYSSELILPHSKIELSIPSLQFKMNVKPSFPLGSGVKPDYEVTPTFQEFLNREPVEVNFILDLELKKRNSKD